MAVGSGTGVLKVFDIGPARTKVAEIIVQTAITSLGFIHAESSECSQVAVVIDGLDGISEILTFCTDSKHVNACDKSDLLKKIKTHDDGLKVVALMSDANKASKVDKRQSSATGTRCRVGGMT
ncbi:hypothetical protein B0H11DRAFT_1902398 [Mycena galericulata]|nr:hypothetical protein B0H11DRAFT_1902398 [Mycena galericulata]